MKLKHCILYVLSLLTFGESVLLFCETASSQSIRWDTGREPIIIPQETKDYILGLFQKGFEHRDRITSGQMEVAYCLKMMDGNGKQENEKTLEVTLAFDEKRHRVEQREVFQKNAAGGDHVPHISVGCIGCYEGNNQILAFYSQYARENDPTSRSILSIYDTRFQFKGQEVTSLWTESLSFIPQYIVYCSTDRFPTKKTLDLAWDRLHVNSLGVLDSEVTDVIVTDELYQETECKKVVFETKWDEGMITRNSMWFAEEQGYALRKHHFQSGTMSDELLEVDVALDKDSGVWFPSAWHYEKSRGGKLRFIEDGTIKNVVLNKPVPEKIFTMEDISMIPPGVIVSWNTERVPPPHGESQFGELLWDGHEIITRGMRAERLVEQSRTEAKSKKRTFIICVNVAVISMILAMFLWRYYKSLR